MELTTNLEQLGLLARAIEIAVEAHKGQVDKAGEPYILHPLRIMHKLVSATDRIVGVLHDVVEDSPDWTIERLRKEGFGEDVLVPLALLTKRKHESYLDSYIARVQGNMRARRVKLADLSDNTDMLRLFLESDLDMKRLQKYRKAIRILSFE